MRESKPESTPVPPPPPPPDVSVWEAVNAGDFLWNAALDRLDELLVLRAGTAAKRYGQEYLWALDDIRDLIAGIRR